MTREDDLPRVKVNLMLEEIYKLYERLLLSAFQHMPKIVRVSISHHLRTPAKAAEKAAD